MDMIRGELASRLDHLEVTTLRTMVAGKRGRP
jgi:hypothetical protein